MASVLLSGKGTEQAPIKGRKGDKSKALTGQEEEPNRELMRAACSLRKENFARTRRSGAEKGESTEDIAISRREPFRNGPPKEVQGDAPLLKEVSDLHCTKKKGVSNLGMWGGPSSRNRLGREQERMGAVERRSLGSEPADSKKTWPERLVMRPSWFGRLRRKAVRIKKPGGARGGLSCGI